MREVSPAVETLLGTQPLNIFHLFRFIFPAGTSPAELRYTTHSQDITIAGLGGTYLTNNSISEFTPPIIERASNREQYVIAFADADFSLRSLAESDIIGSRVTVYFGLINTTQGILGGANPGEPLILEADMTLGFDGLVDSKEYTIDVEESSATFRLECATPMGSLNDVKPYITSKNHVRSLSSSDTSYDDIYDGAVGVDLLWGKIP